MPVVGSNPRARANAHLRWAERYNASGDHAKAAAHVSRALAYGSATADGKRHGFKFGGPLASPVIPVSAALAAFLPSAAARIVGSFTGPKSTGAASARSPGLTIGPRDAELGSGGTVVDYDAFKAGATGVAFVPPSAAATVDDGSLDELKGEYEYKGEMTGASHSGPKELPGGEAPPHPNTESAQQPRGTQWAKSTTTAINELISKLHYDHTTTSWDVALKLRAAAKANTSDSVDATYFLDKWTRELGARLGSSDIDRILDLADEVRGKGGTMPYETDAITGELKPDHALKKGWDGRDVSAIAKSIADRLIAIDRLLIAEYTREFASQPDQGHNPNLIEIVKKRCEIANLVAQLYGDATYTMPARGLHSHLIRLRIYIEWLDKIANVRSNAAGAKLKETMQYDKEAATDGAKDDLRFAGNFASRANREGRALGADGAYTGWIAAAKKAVELATGERPTRVYAAHIEL